MRYALFLLLFILLATSAIGQVAIMPLLPQDIPATIKHEGKIIQATAWEDEAGKHYIILAETGTFYSSEHSEYGDSNANEELFAYHYIQSADSIMPLWRVMDYTYDCQLDHVAKFCKESLTITDLDSNGTPEITFMYKTACAGDVSPLNLKLIMYEGKTKYIIRGNTQVFIDETKRLPSSYVIDISFKSAPSVFLEYAKKHWKKFDAYTYN